MATKLTARPQKLKPSDGPMSRDDVASWDYNHQAYCRQISDWLQFLPGGTRSTWVASEEDETNGIKVMKAAPDQNDEDEEATNKLRANLKNFLACLAIHSPNNFMGMVMRESTSYMWVMEKIKTTFNLNTRGENFLEGSHLKFEFGPDFTYQQAWMQIKDFYSSSLLPAGSKYIGTTLNKKETLSPLANMFLVKEWLTKIHPDLPDYVMKNESQLFTPDRLTLPCNQQLLCDKMESMLQKIENREAMTDGAIHVGNLRPNYPRPRGPLFLEEVYQDSFHLQLHQFDLSSPDQVNRAATFALKLAEQMPLNITQLETAEIGSNPEGVQLPDNLTQDLIRILKFSWSKILPQETK